MECNENPFQANLYNECVECTRETSGSYIQNIFNLGDVKFIESSSLGSLKTENIFKAVSL